MRKIHVVFPDDEKFGSKSGESPFKWQKYPGYDAFGICKKSVHCASVQYLAEDITVERLVGFGRTPHMKFFSGYQDEDRKLIEWAMEVTNISKYCDKEVAKLSGGQRQRVWIAMALAQNTKILFLDEPTTYLDIRYQIEILKLVRKLNREYGITIVMVLHDINQAIHFSDRIIGLLGGKVVVEGNPEEAISAESIQNLYGIELGVTEIDGKKFVLTV
jgi:iron complex transport system ATP-binding protein